MGGSYLMDRKEAVEVLKAIETFYGNKFKIDNPKAELDAWHSILKDYEFDEIMHNLQNYVKTNRFAPSIADIINAGPAKDRAIPTYEETKQLINRWDQERADAADAATANEHLAKMRKILGIKRG
jgi:hypothetical protein